ncbi:MAG: MFS transporter [Alphaproteobacteria bacterium]|nr:MFS transporter [Alphaproteobacteria bacterium]
MAQAGVSDTATPAGTTVIKSAGRFRWVICALLFAATGLNYVDRQTISFLKPGLLNEYGWSEQDYASIVQWFMLAYAFGYVVFGRVIDKIGAKRGYAIAVVIWTFAHLTAATLGFLPVSWLLVSFMVTQGLLGLGQSGNFPAALKAVAEWFPQRERSLANGIFNAGSNVGAILTPLIVPAVLVAVGPTGWLGATGWQWAFVATGSLSIFWLIVWTLIYQIPRESKSVSPEELAYIESDKPAPVKKVAWLKLMTVKETWAFSLGKLLTDPVWWFYLFWLPSFFLKTYPTQAGSIAGVAAPVILIYVISDIGSVAGGWMSSSMIKAGFSVNRARKLTMLLCALCVLPVGFGMMIFHDMWVMTVIIGIAAAAHQAFSANLYTIPSDTFPQAAVGSVSGIGGTAGAIGGIIMALGVGRALNQHLGGGDLQGYAVIFLVAGVIYLIALLVIHLLTPRLAPAKLVLHQNKG